MAKAVMRRSFLLRDLCQSGVDIQPEAPANAHHFVGTGRWPPDPKHTIAFFQKSNRDGMEYLIEGFVADLPGTGQLT